MGQSAGEGYKKDVVESRGRKTTVYSGPGCQKDPIRPLAEFTISTARPTSPACWRSSAIVSWLSSELATTSTAGTGGVLIEAGTGGNGLQVRVGEFAGVGFLDLWTSSSSGIGVGMEIGPFLPDFDDRLCTGVEVTVLVGWGWG